MRKILKRVGITIALLSVIVIVFFIIYEVGGMCVNSLATNKQTKLLVNNLESSIEDIEIIEVYEETGNTSGTGNHVDCFSQIAFTTDLTQEEIIAALEKYYEIDDWGVRIEQDEDGIFLIEVNTSAPFRDNIMGH